MSVPHLNKLTYYKLGDTPYEAMCSKEVYTTALAAREDNIFNKRLYVLTLEEIER